VLLDRAYGEMVASGVLGASTALILSRANNILELPYIGNIAFVVLHESTMLKKLRSFTAARCKQRLFSSRLQRPHFSSAPTAEAAVTDAKAGQFAVRAGDVVVVGTDGIFVNIIEEQLELAV
jgi:protein phosphatase PTC7